jgi:hypothetical protein
MYVEANTPKVQERGHGKREGPLRMQLETGNLAMANEDSVGHKGFLRH